MLVVLVMVVGVIGGVWFLLGPLAGWLAGNGVASVVESRSECIQAVSVLGAAVTVIYGIRRYSLDRDKQLLEADKQVTDRFSGAVAHLGSDDETVRAGGVHALARIMGDSERDHDAVLDTLCGLLRHRATAEAPATRRRPDDVVAAVSALRQRPVRAEAQPPDLAGVRLPEVNLRGARLGGADLTAAEFSGGVLSSAVLEGAQLTGARLAGTRLIGTRLAGARLSEAILTEADLSDADLDSAHLDNAVLDGANLTGASLARADLRRARLRGGTLSGSRWDGADLTDADLRGADLRGASGLTDAMLRAAVTDGDTQISRPTST